MWLGSQAAKRLGGKCKDLTAKLLDFIASENRLILEVFAYRLRYKF